MCLEAGIQLAFSYNASIAYESHSIPCNTYFVTRQDAATTQNGPEEADDEDEEEMQWQDKPPRLNHADSPYEFCKLVLSVLRQMVEGHYTSKFSNSPYNTPLFRPKTLGWALVLVARCLGIDALAIHVSHLPSPAADLQKLLQRQPNTIAPGSNVDLLMQAVDLFNVLQVRLPAGCGMDLYAASWVTPTSRKPGSISACVT